MYCISCRETNPNQFSLSNCHGVNFNLLSPDINVLEDKEKIDLKLYNYLQNNNYFSFFFERGTNKVYMRYYSDSGKIVWLVFAVLNIDVLISLVNTLKTDSQFLTGKEFLIKKDTESMIKYFTRIINSYINLSLD